MRKFIHSTQVEFLVVNGHVEKGDSVISSMVNIPTDVYGDKDLTGFDMVFSGPELKSSYGPDETAPIQSLTSRTLLNPNGEVWIGASYFRHFGDFTIQIIDGTNFTDVAYIQSLPNAFIRGDKLDQSQIAPFNQNPNIVYHQQGVTTLLPEVIIDQVSGNSYKLLPRFGHGCDYNWNLNGREDKRTFPVVTVLPGDTLSIRLNYSFNGSMRHGKARIDRTNAQPSGNRSEDCFFGLNGEKLYELNSSVIECENQVRLDYDLTDVIGDNVKMLIDWGDGTNSTIYGKDENSVSKVYDGPGLFDVAVKLTSTYTNLTTTVVCETTENFNDLNVLGPISCSDCIGPKEVNWSSKDSGNYKITSWWEIKHKSINNRTRLKSRAKCYRWIRGKWRRKVFDNVTLCLSGSMRCPITTPNASSIDIPFLYGYSRAPHRNNDALGAYNHWDIGTVDLPDLRIIDLVSGGVSQTSTDYFDHIKLPKEQAFFHYIYYLSNSDQDDFGNTDQNPIGGNTHKVLFKRTVK